MARRLCPQTRIAQGGLIVEAGGMTISAGGLNITGDITLTSGKAAQLDCRASRRLCGWIDGHVWCTWWTGTIKGAFSLVYSQGLISKVSLSYPSAGMPASAWTLMLACYPAGGRHLDCQPVHVARQHHRREEFGLSQGPDHVCQHHGLKRQPVPRTNRCVGGLYSQL